MHSSSRFLPGFGLSLGYTAFYLSAVVLLPIAALLVTTASFPVADLWAAASSPRALASYRVTLATSCVAALMNAVFGTLVAWCLVRYSFPGRRAVDALIDLPFALPTAISGIALTAVYSGNGWIGRLLKPMGIEVSFTPLGIIVAMVFIGIPFVVRSVQPAFEELDPAIEDAAAILGASRWQTILRVILPQVTPAILAGFTMSFARGLGEYGSVVFIAGNMPFRTEIASLLIVAKLEQFDYAGATAIGCVLLVSSFAILLVLNRMQSWWLRRVGGAA